VYTTSDGGRLWRFHQLPFFSQQLDFVDANSGWTFAGTGASLYRTTDGGNRWVLADLTTASGCWLFSQIRLKMDAWT
jgi:photosystem II stability/assembly factor-like uncharacterized protein